MKLRSKVLAGALSISCLMALGACGNSGNTASEDSNNIRVWLVGTDTPQEARDYLKKTFESENPGKTLTVEEQSWTGLMDKYTTALSGSNSPDVVEIGNTQAITLSAAGAFTDLTDKKADLGGDALLPGFVDAGSFDGKFFAAPYYSGARVITYSSDMVKGENPTTWDEFLTAAKAATTDKVSGLYMPGSDWHDFVTFVWANGGYIAKQGDDGKWVAGFEDPASIKGLQQFQDMFKNANHAAPDAVETDEQIPFCAGDLAYLMSPSWISGSVEAAEDADTPGCASTFGAPEKVHQFAIPGQTAGTFAPVLAGGSNIAIPAKSKNQDLAYKALKIILSDDYQKILAAAGLVPALTTQAQYMPDNEFSKAAADAASAAILTPAAPHWADVEASKQLEGAFTRLAQGDDVNVVAKALDNYINATLNQDAA